MAIKRQYYLIRVSQRPCLVTSGSVLPADSQVDSPTTPRTQNLVGKFDQWSARPLLRREDLVCSPLPDHDGGGDDDGGDAFLSYPATNQPTY